MKYWNQQTRSSNNASFEHTLRYVGNLIIKGLLGGKRMPMRAFDCERIMALRWGI